VSRRRVLTTAAAAAVGTPTLLGGYTWLVEPHWLEITRRDLPVAGLPDALDGRTLVQLSDLHAGPRVDDDYLVGVLDRTAALEPDLVVCTGDWITYRGPAQLDQLRRVLEHFPRGRLGTLGILGNHDYGFGWQMAGVADQVVAAASEAGVRLLRNEATAVAGLTVLGLDDLWGPNFGPEALLAGHNPDLPGIALCHNPDAADRPVWAGFRGWILAGHTHGGQCKPPFLPPPLLPVQNRRYTAGEFALSGDRRLYISRGVGHLTQVRFNVRPEVAVFTLRSAGRVT
jgi:predicted MPP superfamily phosphohydrolase